MIYFSQYKTGRWVLARMSIDGGEPEQVADVEADLWDLSPDGKKVAYSFFDEKLGRWRIAARSLEGNDAVTYFDTATYDVLLWTPDGQSLIYKDAANAGLDPSLWRQPLSGEKPQRFVLPTSEINYRADWSNDGQHIGFVRGREVMNIVMLTRLQSGGVAAHLNRP
jgi:Tol biopolymer transport system component